ncbi:patatin-like phospholipase family protein [Brassicibacter mesophilus]|uniref:patatin-like phospholipase family protein n=1 Tax=Brassicibacter mesophilus TaxID=745119 RepID=UPI003D227C9D
MYGLVLEGGGAKGSYQIGAYKALKDLGIEIKGVAGTSVGAINGAMIAQGDIDRAYEVWYNMNPSRILDIDEKHIEKILEMDLKKQDISSIVKKAKTIVTNGGFDTKYIRALIKDNVDEGKLRESQIDFGIVTVSLTDKKPMELYLEDIPEGKLIDYIMASAYHPAFKLEKMDGKLYLDGGFYDNLPIKLLQKKGYKDIIAIRLYALGRIRKVNEDNLNITYISPSEKLCKTLDFSNRNARKNLKMGYYDTLRAFKGLKGLKFYFNPKDDEDYFMNYLLAFGEEKILNIGKILGIENISYRRMMFELIIPRLIDLLSLDKDCSYEDIVIRLCEEAAKHCNIERFKIHSFEDFISEVHYKYPSDKIKPKRNIPRFIKQNELLSMTAKQEIIDEIVIELFRDINKKI